MRVLVVEDNPTLRETIEAVLEFSDHLFEITHTSSALEAVAHLRSLPPHAYPDVILLGIDMPAMDGFEFRRWQLRAQQYAYIPVILMSKLGWSGDMIAHLNAHGHVGGRTLLQMLEGELAKVHDKLETAKPTNSTRVERQVLAR
jgi:CheY-like chemotaxis protein